MLNLSAPKFPNLLPQRSSRPRTIAMAAYPGVEILDLIGPLEVFSFANVGLLRAGVIDEPTYAIEILAEQAGPVKTLFGVQVVANKAFRDIDTEIDTLMIPGCADISGALTNHELLQWIKQMTPQVRRLASVCTGSFLLADIGLLNDRFATSHWDYCAQLSRRYPAVKVQPDQIFVRDGAVYTSGGITSGIDLALALVEEDWGQELALYVARYLVVFLKRPGGQSQFSAYLTSESGKHQGLIALKAWIMTHLNEDLRVEVLAERVAMSPRNFARLFLAETGMTPAKFVELARLDAARHYLESSELPIETIADKSGFNDPERLRRAFVRHLGVNPQSYRNRFSHTTLTQLGD